MWHRFETPVDSVLAYQWRSSEPVWARLCVVGWFSLCVPVSVGCRVSGGIIIIQGH